MAMRRFPAACRRAYFDCVCQKRLPIYKSSGNKAAGGAHQSESTAPEFLDNYSIFLVIAASFSAGAFFPEDPFRHKMISCCLK